jgi:hypothetical protein
MTIQVPAKECLPGSLVRNVRIWKDVWLLLGVSRPFEEPYHDGSPHTVVRLSFMSLASSDEQFYELDVWVGAMIDIEEPPPP